MFDKLLICIIFGKIKQLMNSTDQDICKAATDGSWKLPKHVLICMSFRSENLIALLNIMGHCEDYCFSLELEIVRVEATDQSSLLLSSQIIRSPSVRLIVHS